MRHSRRDAAGATARFSRSRRAHGLLAGVAAMGLVLQVSVLAAEVTAETAPAEGKALGPVVFDKDKPVEITSDRLDVDQDAQTAIFVGNVDAIQGTFRLFADKLVVHYDKAKETEAGAAKVASTDPGATPEPATDPASTGGRIRRMDVEGNVKVVSPTETATSETAVYEVDKGTINMLGNVVLTRGKNVIHGTKLTVDVDTGKSVIVGGDQSKGRVKSLFVPKDVQTDKSDGKEKTGEAKAGEGGATAPQTAKP